MKINHLHASEGGKHLGELRFLRHYHTAILLFRQNTKVQIMMMFTCYFLVEGSSLSVPTLVGSMAAAPPAGLPLQPILFAISPLLLAHCHLHWISALHQFSCRDFNNVLISPAFTVHVNKPIYRTVLHLCCLIFMRCHGKAGRPCKCNSFK